MKKSESNPGFDVNQIVHEISNPLNGMLTSIQLLERHLVSRSQLQDEFITASLQNLKSEINRLRGILSDARSREASGLQLKLTNLSHITSAVIQNQKPEFDTHRIRIVEEFSPDLPPVLADQTKLQQALLNLFKNSIEAMPHGGTLRLRTFHQRQFVILEIADTGGGISKDVKAFKCRTTTKSGGMGLGLSIVRDIVAAHKGKITYNSKPGEGTRFRLSLVRADRHKK